MATAVASLIRRAVDHVADDVVKKITAESDSDILNSMMHEAEAKGFTKGFDAGYAEGKHDGMVAVGAILASLSFLLAISLSRIYLSVRRRWRGWSIAQVQDGTKHVVAVQKLRNRVLDLYCQVISLTVGVEFYITFLPFLFWVGESQLARSMTLLMALAVYTGNAMKDVLCAPRPLCPPVKRLVKGHGVQEYGMPSTHALNGICMTCYLLHWYWSRGALTPHQMLIITIILIIWIFSVCFGRLYLGMHSPSDLAVGVVFGVVLLVYWCLIDDYIDAWVTTGSQVPLFQICMSAVLIYSYPVPLDPTPSYVYAVYFTGVAFGVITGCWRQFARFHCPASSALHYAHRRNLDTLTGWYILGGRMVVGMICVLFFKFALDFLCQKALPPLCAAFGIPTTDVSSPSSSQWEKDKSPKSKDAVDKMPSRDDPLLTPPACDNCGSTPWTFNITTARRFVSYAGVGWAVVEPSMFLFEIFGL